MINDKTSYLNFLGTCKK